MKNKEPKIIAMTLQKGGLGKTACTVNLAAMLSTRKPSKYSRRKIRVLIIDMDVHATASHYLDAYNEQEYGIYDVMTGKCSFDEAIKTRKYEFGKKGICQIDIIPTYIYAATLENKWLEYENPKFMLFDAMKKSQKLNEYDYIFIDSPPESNCLLSNIYNACNYYLFPVFADTQSYINLGITYEQINTLSSNKREKKVLGCIINNFEKTELSYGYKEAFLNHPNIHCFESVIPHCKRYDQTLFEKMPIPFYHRNIHEIQPIFNAFNQLTDEFVKRIQEM